MTNWMNTEDDFEKRLRAQPLRQVPTEWRAQILRAAAAEGEGSKPQRLPEPLGACIWAWVRGLFSPDGKAWAGLAAAWVVIVGLHLATHDSAVPMAGGLVRPSPQMREMLAQQARVMAELLGPVERPTPGPAVERWRAGPRSQTRLDLHA